MFQSLEKGHAAWEEKPMSVMPAAIAATVICSIVSLPSQKVECT
jgi:hypothetical protein